MIKILKKFKCLAFVASMRYKLKSSNIRPKTNLGLREEGEIMELSEAIMSRRSIRKYLKKDLPDQLLIQAFEVARWAPSGGNFQSWKFLIVKNQKIIGKIADVVQTKVDMLSGWPEVEEYKGVVERYRKNAAFFREAPVLILAFTGEYKSVVDLILSKRGEKDPFAMEMIKNRQSAPTRVQQIGGFVTLLLLTLHSFGLGACWMAGPLVAKKEIEKILEISEEWDLAALIPVGDPAETPAVKPRKSVDEFVVIVK